MFSLLRIEKVTSTRLSLFAPLSFASQCPLSCAMQYVLISVLTSKYFSYNRRVVTYKLVELGEI